MRLHVIFYTSIAVVLMGCNGNKDDNVVGTNVVGTPKTNDKSNLEKPITDDPTRHAYVATDDPLGENVTRVKYLDQHWGPSESIKFYYTAQGSQIIPYSWFLALKQPDSDRPISDKKNMLKYRFLAQNAGPMNPDGLPVGFVADQGVSRVWLGMTCAACHTSEVRYENVGYRVDGGPSQADVQGFFTELVLSMKKTLANPTTFAKFASEVLAKEKSGDSKDIQESLREDLSNSINIRDGYNQRNFFGYDPNEVTLKPPTRFGRLDAVDAIVNEVYWHAVKNPNDKQPTVVARPADALVSYPCLWDTPQHFSNLEWLGIAKSGGPLQIFSLARNVGEVLGVFGDYALPDKPSLFSLGYASSVKFQELRALESSLVGLWSPKWPSDFPKIDEKKRAAGEVIYKRSCLDCHALIERESEKRDAHEKLIVLDESPTDDRAYTNFFNHTRPSGKLEGVRSKFVPFSEKIEAVADADSMVSNTVIGVILGGYKEAPRDQLARLNYQGLGMKGVEKAVPYKSRPLNGIWATAPYLHNGSVPTLDALLQSAKSRPKTFPIGVRTFDPVRVGYLTEKADFERLRLSIENFPTFNVLGSDGKPIVGNSSEGHEFGTVLSPTDREALIEYLKSL